MSERPSPAEVELARAGLLEITDASSIGAAFARVDEVEGVVSVLFHCTLDGYPGWHWTVSIAAVDGEEPTVLEAELLPGEGALLAPDWVPWADRLADYQATQAAEGDDESDGDHDEDDLGDGVDDEEDESDDEPDDDDLGDDVYDGVDVDDLAADADGVAEQDEADDDADADGDERDGVDDDADEHEHDEDDERG